MVIPFYGTDHPDMFEIERAAMDREGKVLAALDSVLPQHGRILDIGAGNGFTAERLRSSGRSIVACEPSRGMIDPDVTVDWVQAAAQGLPFRDATFEGVYSTWAYFFPSFHDIAPGLHEVRRVARPGAPIVIVDNAGQDEFTNMSPHGIAADLDYWLRAGFEIGIIDTAFEFETLEDATALLTFYFGDQAKPAKRISYRVAIMVSR
ncbi:MAG: class I SAM-dependent methyltransferase [Actinomycetota bacterium]